MQILIYFPSGSSEWQRSLWSLLCKDTDPIHEDSGSFGSRMGIRGGYEHLRFSQRKEGGAERGRTEGDTEVEYNFFFLSLESTGDTITGCRLQAIVCHKSCSGRSTTQNNNLCFPTFCFCFPKPRIHFLNVVGIMLVERNSN